MKQSLQCYLLFLLSLLCIVDYCCGLGKPVIILVIPVAQGRGHKEAREKEKGQRQRQKKYANKHRRAKERKVEVGDQLLIRHKKTSMAKITARRGRERKTRNIGKRKVLKERPAYLQKPQKKSLTVASTMGSLMLSLLATTLS